MIKSEKVLVDPAVAHYKIKLCDNNVKELLFDYIPEGAFDIEVYVQIPGGGDYSNMDFEITKTDPIIISYSIVE